MNVRNGNIFRKINNDTPETCTSFARVPNLFNCTCYLPHSFTVPYIRAAIVASIPDPAVHSFVSV